MQEGHCSPPPSPPSFKVTHALPPAPPPLSLERRRRVSGACAFLLSSLPRRSPPACHNDWK